jgi:hypothetical protein
MYIYNVTSKVSWQIHDEWLQWMIGEHIPEMLTTGLFIKHQLVRLQDVDEIEGPTYAVQYYLQNKEFYNRYIIEKAALLREKSMARWGDDVIAFRTLMEVIN